MKLRTLSFLLAPMLTFVTIPAVRAEVSAYGGEETPGRSIVVLEVAGITDGDGPWEAWQPQSEPDSGLAHVLNPEGATNQDGRPSIVLHPTTRTPIAAWPRRTADGHEIVVSRFVQGAWSAPVVVDAGGAGTDDPFLTADPDSGNVHLFYRTGGARPHIAHRQASSDATDWGPATIVSAFEEIAARPSATWHAGELLAAYEVHLGALGSASRQIVVVRLQGNAWIGGVVAGTAYDGPNEPEIHSDGIRVWVDWVDAPDAMGWTRRTIDGSWAPLTMEPFADVEDRKYHVRGRIKHAVREP